MATAMVIREASTQPHEIRLPLESGGSTPPRTSRPVTLCLVVLAAAALGLASRAALGLSFGRASLAFGLGLLLFALLEQLVSRSRTAVANRASRTWLSIDDDGIAREDDKARTRLARWGEPFGLSVLSNTARSKALLAFTTPTATRFLGLCLDSARDADAARDLMARAITVPDADLELAAPATDDVRLGAGSAHVLLEELTRRDAEVTQRIYLSDARGMAIALEGDTLSLGGQTFDLSATLDWRVFTFHEGDPGVLTLYQATAIKQGAKELCLVCRAPAELASWAVGRAADAPPPRETRVAIDRLFMTPLRAALERAPRVSRSGQAPRSRGKSVQT
jgi:hypothetical protein